VDLEAGVFPQERPGFVRMMRPAPVPEDQDGSPANVPEEMAEELDYRRGGDGAFVDLDVELPAWGDPADDRELRPSSLVDDYRGLSHRGPGLGHVGDERKPTLIEEDYDGALSPGFFLYRGQE